MGNKIAVKSDMDNEELIGHLTGLIDGLRRGRILVEHGTDFIVLYVSKQVSVKVSTKVKPNAAKLKLSLTWPLDNSHGKTDEFFISDGSRLSPTGAASPSPCARKRPADEKLPCEVLAE